MSINLTKRCEVCANEAPRGWTESRVYKCKRCQEDALARAKEVGREHFRYNVNHLEQARQIQRQAAAQRTDPRSAAMAQHVGADRSGNMSQQDPTLATMTYITLDYSSIHRDYEASSVSSACENSGSIHSSGSCD